MADRKKSGALKSVTIVDIQVKFKDCASLVVPDDVTAELLSRLGKLEELDDLSGVMDLLRAG